ncbi:lipoate--protein ligase family protein [Gottfriedia luciferensis]|uniref:lipoate--protein ligase family protein n=1 Tax=Gottfriedia luciferensis TaxID=178774 RepID=UPI000B453FF5|nr:biotin/lipoate A/B protein ligase family protein [Gottfriedia luciferensis]
MNQHLNRLKKDELRFIDGTTLGPSFEAIQSFALDDTLCTKIGLLESPTTIRTWVHHQTIVLGIQDTRLPNLENGVNYLNEQGYKAIVRNSGGLAVVLDEGVLNISILFPEAEHRLQINDGYETMYALIQDMFQDLTDKIVAKEIVGSYCPGDFDLSIDGKKFAGISQRRIRKGVAVQIYLCVNESGSKRASIIKEFYEIAINQKETSFKYPSIVPDTMASLSELLSINLTVSDVMKRLLQSLIKLTPTIIPSSLDGDEVELYNHHLQRMINRNEEIDLMQQK